MKIKKPKLHNFDSDEEFYFDFYLRELYAAGMITWYRHHPDSYILSDSLKYGYDKQLKTKTVTNELSLLREHSYTTDFIIRWNENARNIFFQTIDSRIDLRKTFFIANEIDKIVSAYSIIEIKADFSEYNMDRVFSLNQRWLYDKHKLYAQKVLVSKKSPKGVFQSTFCPRKYLYTEKTNKLKKLHYKPKTIAEFIEYKRKNP